jgi:MFS transporter, DHA1 family, multidrug resistance protein
MTTEEASPPGYLIPLLAAFTSLVVLTTDVYLPVLPQLGIDLGTNDGSAAATISAVLIGVAVGQIVLGPVSDAIGRKVPLIIGVLAYGVFHAVSAVAPTIGVLLTCRVLVGLATAACLVVSRAIVADAFPGPRSAIGYSTLSAVIAIAPVLAPIAGGLLAHIMTWRGMFLLLAGLAFALAVVGWFALPETLPPERRIAPRMAVILRDIGAVARQRRFLAYAVAAAATSGVLFAYIGASSFVLENLFDLTPQQFSLVFAANAAGLFVLSWVTRAIVMRVGALRILLVGQSSTLVGCALLGCGLASSLLPLVLLGLFLAIASMGLVMPSSMSLGMQVAIGGAGAAAGLMGIMQFTTGAVLSPIAGLGSTGWAMVTVMSASALCGTVGRALLSRGTVAPPVPARP